MTALQPTLRSLRVAPAFATFMRQHEKHPILMGDASYCAHWLHLLFDNECVFVAWAGESYEANVCAVWRLRDGTCAVYEGGYGSCTGCGNDLQEYGFAHWLANVLPAKLTWFNTRELARAHVAALNLERRGYGGDAHCYIDTLGAGSVACTDVECVRECRGADYWDGETLKQQQQQQQQ